MALALGIAGIACILYGVSVMIVWSGTKFFAVWLALGALLLGGAWAVQSGRWEGIPLIPRRIIEGLAVVAIAICVITQGLALTCFSNQGEDDLDCLIVLGAQVREGAPSAVLQMRLDAACDYLAANPGTRCIVSGGQGGNEPAPEAHVMKRYLTEHGINPARISVEDRSLNTVENLRNCLPLVDAEHDRIGIITNNFHLFRALGIARKQGMVHVCGIAAPSTPWYLPNNLFRETFAISKDFLQGNV